MHIFKNKLAVNKHIWNKRKEIVYWFHTDQKKIVLYFHYIIFSLL